MKLEAVGAVTVSATVIMGVMVAVELSGRFSRNGPFWMAMGWRESNF